MVAERLPKLEIEQNWQMGMQEGIEKARREEQKSAIAAGKEGVGGREAKGRFGGEKIKRPK